MRRQPIIRPIIRLIYVAFGFILFLNSNAAATVSVPRERVQEIYKSIHAQMYSSASPSEKMQFLELKNKEYVVLIHKMKADAKRDPAVLDSKDYIYAWDLYDQIIPLLNLKLDASKSNLTRKSCLESMSLITSLEQPAPSEEDLPALSPQSQATLNMLKQLCQLKR